MSCNCRRDPKTKYCPAWRVIRRDSVRSMYAEGASLGEIASWWGMQYIGSVINQLGDDYGRRARLTTARTVLGENDNGETVSFSPVLDANNHGFAVCSIYRAIQANRTYKGFRWRIEG